MVVNDEPEHVGRDPRVFVSKYVPDGGDLPPRDAWMAGFHIVGEVPAGL
jgi:hypothetical protein